MPDFTIRIPRVSVAIAEATLIDKLVADGDHVEEGDPLFTIETDKVETEIQAGATGTVHWTGQEQTTYDIGTEIGVINTTN